MINKETIEKIRETARIEEVVGDFVSLKKRGVNMIGLCPFHNEKTPSFTVSPAKGIFKCFGCSEAGTSVDFVMKHEHFTYPQALKYLADKYHIEVEDVEQTAEQIAAENEREGLYAVSQIAQKYFKENLKTEQGAAIGLSYFRERGFSEQTIEKFQLGYSLEQWDGFYQYATTQGYKLEYLTKVGLVIEKEGKIYDRFRNRVMFPIHNISGRVIGFGGRILSNDKNQPKYVNSPESEIYNKSEVLYGIYFAKNEIIKKDNCYLVEGYTDVISMHLAGIENVVASSGTSLTTGQIKLIKRFTQNITILYDGDAAGIKASFRGIDMIVEEGMNVRIVHFPEGEDPDSFARSHGSQEVQDFIHDKTQNFITFKSELLKKEAEGDPVKQAELVKDIVQTISLIPDQITRLFYVRECSNLLNVQEQVLVNEVNKYRRKKFNKENADESPVPEPQIPKTEVQILSKEDNDYNQEKELIRILVSYGNHEFSFEKASLLGDSTDEDAENHNIAVFIVNDLLQDEIQFNHPVLQKIFDEFIQSMEIGTIPGEYFFINHPDNEIKNNVIDAITQKYSLSPNYKEKHKMETSLEDDPQVLSRSVISSLFSLKDRKIKKQIRDIDQWLLENNQDEIDISLKLKTRIKLKEVSNMLNQALGRIVI